MTAPVDILVFLAEVDAVQKIGFFLLLILSLAVHEWGHAWSALKLGDDLAQRLVKRGGGFRRELFRSLNNDAALLDEVNLGLSKTKEPVGSSVGSVTA